MNCPNCGTSNLDTASICANCGRPLNAPPPPPPPIPPPQTASYTPPPPQRPPVGARPMGSGAPIMPGEKIPNYLIPSVIMTLCCCLPFGILGLIFGAQVNSKLAAGDVQGAREASNKAKMFLLIGLGIWLLMLLLAFLGNGAAIIEGIRDGFENR